jgi:hypothetical protein
MAGGCSPSFHVGDQFLYGSAADPACFRIPGYVIAAFERPGHLFRATGRMMHAARQWSGEKRCQPCFQRHEGYYVPA